MAHIKSISGKSPLRKVINYVTNREKTNDELISGINCSFENVRSEMNYTKSYYNKKDGIQYYHVIQSFKPGEITPDKAHELGKEFAQNIAPDYECLVVTHNDKKHIHNHIVINSVSFKDGKKYQVEKGAYNIKKESDKICEREHLSILENKRTKDNEKISVRSMSSNEYRAAINKNVEWWKGKVIIDIRESKLKAHSKEEFIACMNDKGYKVKWEDNRKYITYTTPEGKKVRDNKLYDKNLLKENMENGFREIIRAEHDARSENYSERSTSTGIIESTIRNSIERDKQELHRTEDNISKLSGVDIYSELSKQGASQGKHSINNEIDGLTRESNKESGRTIEQLQEYSGRANPTDGQVHQISSQGGSTGGIQKSAETRETKTDDHGQNHNNNDRGISDSSHLLNKYISNNLSKEITKRKDGERER